MAGITLRNLRNLRIVFHGAGRQTLSSIDHPVIKDELKTGTRHAMLRQLGLSKEDL